MNPIDQLMQSLGSSPYSALAGVFGAGQATGTEQGAIAAQFAQALQTIEAASTVSTAKPNGASDLTIDQSELLASLQAALALEASPATQFAGLIPAVQSDAASTATYPALLAKNSVSGLAIQTALANADGASGFTIANGTTQQLGQHIPILPQADLERLGLKLEQLPALPTSEELAAVSQAGGASNSHILPVDAAQGLFGTAVENASVLSLSADSSTVVLAPELGSQAGNTASVVPEPALTAPLNAANTPALSTDPLTLPEQAQAALGTQAASTTLADTPQVDAAQHNHSVPAPAEAAQDSTSQRAHPAPASAAAQATDAEANGVVTQQAQQQVAAAAPKPNSDRNLQAGHKSAGVGKETIDLKANAAPAADTLKEAASAKPVESVAPLPATQAPPPAREAQPPLTPERVSGFFDGTSASAVAAGLSGLKGDSGFMASMSLLGGKPTPELAQQVSQQLNMHVTKAFKDGQQEFTIRLDPTELGRVRVKLSFLEGGRVHAQVMAERPETLDLMQRDTRGLEKAIEAAGHKADGGIQFSLDTNDQESAGRAFAEAVQQEKMRDGLAARMGTGQQTAFDAGDDLLEETVPLETILANVSVETGLDIEV